MSESHNLFADIEPELASLHDETTAVAPLLQKLEVVDPDPVELRAVAATLHAFYTGLERILITIAKRKDRRLPNSPQWHRDLLAQMKEPVDDRPPLLTEPLDERFGDYLAFRHVFRHSYSDQIDWSLMRPLCDEMVETLGLFEARLREAFDCD